MFERIGRLAEKTADGLSRRAFLTRMGLGALALTTFVTGVHAAPVITCVKNGGCCGGNYPLPKANRWSAEHLLQKVPVQPRFVVRLHGLLSDRLLQRQGLLSRYRIEVLQGCLGYTLLSTETHYVTSVNQGNHLHP
jgi:hypothetical protein